MSLGSFSPAFEGQWRATGERVRRDLPTGRLASSFSYFSFPQQWWKPPRGAAVPAAAVVVAVAASWGYSSQMTREAKTSAGNRVQVERDSGWLADGTPEQNKPNKTNLELGPTQNHIPPTPYPPKPLREEVQYSPGAPDENRLFGVLHYSAHRNRPLLVLNSNMLSIADNDERAEHDLPSEITTTNHDERLKKKLVARRCEE